MCLSPVHQEIFPQLSEVSTELLATPSLLPHPKKEATQRNEFEKDVKMAQTSALVPWFGEEGIRIQGPALLLPDGYLG